MMITAPMAISHVMIVKIAPMAPQVLLSAVIVAEKQNLENMPRPAKQTPVAMADGTSLRHRTLPASRKCIVHQTNGAMITKVTAAASQIPPVRLRTGRPIRLRHAATAHSAAAQIGERYTSRMPR
jgi:hypothetical protein